MVDVNTALQASAYNDRKRKSGGSAKDDDSKSRKIEPFDPIAYAKKETADMYSMWLVIIYGLGVAALLRYVMMPTMTEPDAILYLIPLLLCVTVPSLHKLLIPKKHYELYTKGNWFRACMLFIFSWLALSFALVNPPIADIAPPTTAGGLDIEVTDGIIDATWKGGEYTIGLDQGTVDIVLGFAVRDNVDAETAMLSGEILYRGEIIQTISSGTVISHTDEIATFDAIENWTRGAKVAPHEMDIGLAWDLGTLSPGEYTIHIVLSEQGDPWENVWDKTYTIIIAQTSTA
jgi:hypothetical protein